MELRPRVHFVSSALAVFALFASGCGDDDTPQGTSGSGAGGTGTGGAGAVGATGGEGGAQGGAGAASTGGTGGDPLYLTDCETNADCGSGECVALNGDYKVCQQPVVEATSCTGAPEDECCNSSECTAPAKCLEAPLVSSCGGAAPLVYNVCATDECATNDDCEGGTLCAPAGTVGNQVAICFTAQCSGFCGQESLSPCALVRDPCCQNALGFMCIPKGGCTTNADCPDGYCEVGVCKTGAPPCPP
jgi:hypothetical protein